MEKHLIIFLFTMCKENKQNSNDPHKKVKSEPYKNVIFLSCRLSRSCPRCVRSLLSPRCKLLVYITLLFSFQLLFRNNRIKILLGDLKEPNLFSLRAVLTFFKHFSVVVLISVVVVVVIAIVVLSIVVQFCCCYRFRCLWSCCCCGSCCSCSL